MRLSVLKVSIPVLMLAVFQTGDCGFSGRFVRKAKEMSNMTPMQEIEARRNFWAEVEGQPVAQPASVSREALVAEKKEDPKPTAQQEEKKESLNNEASSSASRKAPAAEEKEDSKPTAQQEEKKESLNNEASDEESKTESNSDTETEARWSIPQVRTKEYFELLGTNDETTKEGTIWYFVRGLGKYDDETGPEALDKLLSAHDYFKILRNYQDLSWKALKAVVDTREKEDEKAMAVYVALLQAVQRAQAVLKVENDLIDALNNERSIDDLEKIIKDSGLSEIESLQIDMELIRNILSDAGLGRFDSSYQDVMNTIAEMQEVFLKLYSDKEFNNFKPDSEIRANLEALKQKVENISGQVDQSQGLIQTMFDRWNVCQEFLKNFNGSENVRGAVENILNRKDSIRDEISNLFMVLANKLPGVNRHIKELSEEVNYGNPTEAQANSFTREQCEESVKSGIIVATNFSHKAFSYGTPEATAYRSIRDKVEVEGRDIEPAKNRESSGLQHALRVLISNNAKLFKDVEFVRSIREDLMSLRSICDMDASHVKAMFTVISNL